MSALLVILSSGGCRTEARISAKGTGDYRGRGSDQLVGLTTVEIAEFGTLCISPCLSGGLEVGLCESFGVDAFRGAEHLCVRATWYSHRCGGAWYRDGACRRLGGCGRS